MKLISIVVPMYNESAVISTFFAKISEITKGLSTYQFEIITVNDGSKDDTYVKMLEAQQTYENIVIVNLTRNFGHEAAVAAGLSVAKGVAVIPMDADLQDPPEVIEGMLKMFEEGYDVVNARRASRKEDTFIKRFTAKKFYQVIDSMAGKVRVPQNVGHFRLISRRVLDEVLKLKEHNRVFRVQVPYIGYKTGEIAFIRPKRELGKTHYNFKSMFDLAFNAIISTTIKPVYWALKFAMFMIFITSISLLTQLGFYITDLFINFSFAVYYQTWSIINVILVIASINMFFLGIMSIYLGKTFAESQNRPFFLIESVKTSKE